MAFLDSLFDGRPVSRRAADEDARVVTREVALPNGTTRVIEMTVAQWCMLDALNAERGRTDTGTACDAPGTEREEKFRGSAARDLQRHYPIPIGGTSWNT